MVMSQHSTPGDEGLHNLFNGRLGPGVGEDSAVCWDCCSPEGCASCGPGLGCPLGRLPRVLLEADVNRDLEIFNFFFQGSI